jgi:LTXXQ motif family protein
MTLKPILAALLISAALPAAAQTAPAAPDGAPMTQRDPAMMQQRHAAMQQHFARIQQRHADDLALLLDLKPAQRPALDAFLRSAHHGMGEGRMGEGRLGEGRLGEGRLGRRPEGAPEAGTRPTPPNFAERLDRMDQFAAHRAEAGHQRIAAVKAFYQSLDPHQQQLFEAVMRMRHGGHGAMGGRMHGGHPGGRGGPGPMGGPEAPQG